MRKIYSVLGFIFFGLMAQGQIVNIPDANFKAKLISLGFDLNSDGQIDQEEIGAIQLPTLDLSNAGIVDLTGLEHFSNSYDLNVSGNSISNIDIALGVGFASINAADNLISAIDYHDTANVLIDLVLDNNPITSIATSGISISDLSLTGCSGITDISIINTTGETFFDYDQVPNLQTLEMTGPNNDMGYLNGILPNLTSIHFIYGGGMLSIINMPALQSLQLTNYTNTSDLFIDNTGLTSLDLSEAIYLTSLNVSNSPITSVVLGSQLYMSLLVFDNLPLTSVDASGVHSESFDNISLTNCPNLEYVNLKNGVTEDFIDVTAIFLCIDEEQFPSVQTMFASDPTVIYSTYCSFTPGGDYNTINGVVKFDANSDGCSDDAPFPYLKVTFNDGTDEYATYTNNAGNYAFYAEAGDYTVSPEFESAGFIVNPASTSVNFTDDLNNISTADFCITPNGINPDLEVVVSPWGDPVPGFDATYQVTLRNKGNQAMSQIAGLSCSYDMDQMDYISTDPPANSFGPGIIYWDYTNLMPFEIRTFLCTVNIHPPTDENPVNSGDMVQVSASVNSQGDVLPADNNFDLTQTAVNSQDPNDILCLEGDSQPTSAIGEYLHYRVRFENTGTAPAQNVVVRLPLNPNQYQVNSLQLLSASHEVIGRVRDNVAEFIFQSINLDSGGHGNVLLKVRSSDVLQQGDSVINGAGIYFDYNFPVETNNAETVFEDLSISDNDRVSLTLYPNPVIDKLQFTTESVIESIEIFDASGRLVSVESPQPNQTEYRVTNLKSGLYFAKVYTEQGSKTLKFIKK